MAAEPFRQGAGRLCLDFTRTLRRRGHPDAVEELPTPAAVLAWVTQFGPVPATVASLPPADVQRFREAVFTLVTKGPAGCAATDLDLVNRIAAAPPPIPAVQPAGTLDWTAGDPVAATLSLVARDALDLATTPAASRIRECADPACSALFVDNSRPGTRRWCAMSACGNRAKKTAYRDRATAG
ncbi:hypothetical protein ACWT_2057 [Actinoplanes sp. SE50]|uniref:CGNR zinc finger domain-containing protein n=1 Tax=unclassified Actinoplanes TaxID=2626549 RepID=UPI00023EC5BB|nr:MULTISPECIES: ABATE domain-containing protein [unclassified Actinoplanes]AEV83076.1 hypothetical protein ACPL_2179 [Actinoplanes sp. SE50/110]ATO81472.1 hypothetical protein ACWT_2057 [Actinoplanes sp. SE50]SLL98879.1 hypothetical protein ACSP50_2106 [Actinoplanes sp. SE50/110]